ncbi:uncharacterized protein LOC132561656 [Ylistrum balloti]|uniref:uncharacterized protein LOC132561656 n=1 Tax=Ylistrum balloti TaxID=509963 RepID=UPI002905CC90|nr:uncharacterized protein LOC132561656 [Ylistrum balloti]
MDYLYFILVVLVFLKVLFWIFYFYARSQRLRARRTTQHNFFVVERTRHIATGVTHDQAGIIQNEHPQAYTNPPGPQNFPQPPSYNECVSQPQTESKPPSYEQVIQGQGSTNLTTPYAAPPTVITSGQNEVPSPNPMYGYNQ